MRSLIVLLALSAGGPYGRAAGIQEDSSRDNATRASTVASFAGSGQNSIQALAVDSGGNIFVAGTTNSPDLPVLNAAQPVMGESRIMASTDGGATWKRVGNQPPDTISVAADPDVPQVLLASGNAGVYKSTDGGQTWRTVYSSPTRPAAQGYCAGPVVFDPGDHLRAAALVGDGSIFYTMLIRSLDGGESWTATGQRSGCVGITEYAPLLLADLSGSGALAIAGEISRDWGANFRQIPAGMGFVAFDPSHPGSIYMIGSQQDRGTLSFSTDFGVTWTSKSVPSAYCNQITGLVVDPDRSTALVANTLQCGYFKSTDGGATWQATPHDTFYPSGEAPFLILSRQCSGGGGIIALGGTAYLSFVGEVSTNEDEGSSWSLPRLGNVSSISATGCTVYATRYLASDVFISKLAPDGTPLWTTFLGGSNEDVPVALALDVQGNVYVAGNTHSPDFPTTLPVMGTPGLPGLFVTKFSSSGKVVYSLLVGGAGATTAAVDASQNVYIVGTAGSQLPVTPGVLVEKPDPNGGTGFLIKLSSDAALVYATYLGPSFTLADGIVVNAAGQTILAGTGAIPGSPSQLRGPPVGFVAELNATGTQVLSAIQF